MKPMISLTLPVMGAAPSSGVTVKMSSGFAGMEFGADQQGGAAGFSRR
jgi:hypothetical protein